MIKTIAVEIEAAIKNGDFQKSIDILRAWLRDCELGQPNQLLKMCSVTIRAQVRNLMCDLLSCYPDTMLGLPLLIFGTAKNLDDGFLTLPFPAFEQMNPCPGLHFLGWLRCDALLPVALPFCPEQYDVEVACRVPTAYVGVFRTLAHDPDVGVNAVSAMWWGDLFFNRNQSNPVGNVRLESNFLYPYPEAIEIAAAMQAGARNGSAPECGDFHENLQWAYQKGVSFYENCCLPSFDVLSE